MPLTQWLPNYGSQAPCVWSLVVKLHPYWRLKKVPTFLLFVCFHRDKLPVVKNYNFIWKGRVNEVSLLLLSDTESTQTKQDRLNKRGVLFISVKPLTAHC